MLYTVGSMRRKQRKTARSAFRIDAEFKAVVPFLASPLRRQLLVQLGHGLSTVGELSRQVDVPASRVDYHIKRLASRKLVQARGKGRSRSYRLGSSVQVVHQGKRDVLTVSIKRSSISISSGQTDAPPWK